MFFDPAPSTPPSTPLVVHEAYDYEARVNAISAIIAMPPSLLKKETLETFIDEEKTLLSYRGLPGSHALTYARNALSALDAPLNPENQQVFPPMFDNQNVDNTDSEDSEQSDDEVVSAFSNDAWR